MQTLEDADRLRTALQGAASAVVIGAGFIGLEFAASARALGGQAGLMVENGVLVDAALLTSDPDISAIGGIAAFPQPVSGKRIRLESVQNATDQARAVAARLTGKPAPYEAVPWFWSDQGALKLQIAGLRSGSEENVVLGDPATRSFSVLCIADGVLRAVETVNRPGDHMLARKLLAKGVRVTAAQASAPGFELKALAT